MKKLNYFNNHLLIAMPALQDSFFTKCVVYLYEHSEAGALGLVINKKLHVPTLQDLVINLKVGYNQNVIKKIPLFSGGPIGLQQGFILYKDKEEINDTQKAHLSSSKKILSDISLGKGPSEFLITLGYSGWGKGQVEEEINRNDWLIAPFSEQVIFSTPIEQRWYAAAKTIGIDLNYISQQVGNA